MKTFRLYQDAMAAIQSGEIKTGDVIKANGGTYSVTAFGSLYQADEPRDWTDEQDEVAYDTFRELADHKGTAFARDTMRGIRRMGAKFHERDLTAWVQRYVDEHVTTCEWFAMCDREAATTRSHPVLGEVPICDRCDRKF